MDVAQDTRKWAVETALRNCEAGAFVETILTKADAIYKYVESGALPEKAAYSTEAFISADDA